MRPDTKQELLKSFHKEQEDYIKYQIAKKLLKENGTTREDLKSVLTFFNQGFSQYHYIFGIAQAWLIGKGKTRDDLKFVLEYIHEFQDKKSIAEEWFREENERTREDFKLVLKFVEQQDTFATSWFLEKEGRSREDLEAAMPSVRSQKTKESIVETWFLEEKERPREDLEAALKFLSKGLKRNKIVKDWFSEKKGRSREDLEFALKFFSKGEERDNFAEAWFLEETARPRADLESVLLFFDSDLKANITKAWFLKKGERTKDDLVFALRVVSKDNSQGINYLAGDPSEKADIVVPWLKTEGIKKEDFLFAQQYFSQLFSQRSHPIMSRLNQAWLENWLEKGEGTKENFQFALQLASSVPQKDNITKVWFSEKSEKTREDLKLALSCSSNVEDQCAMATLWLLDNPTEIAQIILETYPNHAEDKRLSMFENLCNSLPKEILNQSKSQLLEFVTNLQNERSASDALKNLSQKLDNLLSPEEFAEVSSCLSKQKHGLSKEVPDGSQPSTSITTKENLNETPKNPSVVVEKTFAQRLLSLLSPSIKIHPDRR